MKAKRKKSARLFTRRRKSKIGPSSATTDFHERQNISVLDAQHYSQKEIPECAHGPCLLFADSSGSRWFGCAVFRSLKLCRFRRKYNENWNITNKFTNKANVTTQITDYGHVSNSYNKLVLSGAEPYWCHKCKHFIPLPHDEHPDCCKGPFAERPSPLDLLDTIQEDAGEAQYWFSKETIGLVEETLASQNADSILCVGTPTLFEKFKQNGRNAFLLDFDDRLSHFYSANEFARFSMLVCHFFVPQSEQYLLDFFRRSTNKLVCICDPPFGVHVSALMRTIYRLKQMFLAANNASDKTFNALLFLPYFAGKHLVQFQSMSMVDYKVTYRNHKEYSRARKSIVRMFTDLPNSMFKLPSKLGYHFCEQCDRFVARENRHCWKCSECTSKDGTPYRHCDRCKRCVRRKYKHCKLCEHCHLLERCRRNESTK